MRRQNEVTSSAQKYKILYKLQYQDVYGDRSNFKNLQYNKQQVCYQRTYRRIQSIGHVDIHGCTYWYFSSHKGSSAHLAYTNYTELLLQDQTKQYYANLSQVHEQFQWKRKQKVVSHVQQDEATDEVKKAGRSGSRFNKTTEGTDYLNSDSLPHTEEYASQYSSQELSSQQQSARNERQAMNIANILKEGTSSRFEDSGPLEEEPKEHYGHPEMSEEVYASWAEVEDANFELLDIQQQISIKRKNRFADEAPVKELTEMYVDEAYQSDQRHKRVIDQEKEGMIFIEQQQGDEQKIPTSQAGAAKQSTNPTLVKPKDSKHSAGLRSAGEVLSYGEEIPMRNRKPDKQQPQSIKQYEQAESIRKSQYGEAKSPRAMFLKVKDAGEGQLPHVRPSTGKQFDLAPQGQEVEKAQAGQKTIKDSGDFSYIEKEYFADPDLPSFHDLRTAQKQLQSQEWNLQNFESQVEGLDDQTQWKGAQDKDQPNLNQSGGQEPQPNQSRGDYDLLSSDQRLRFNNLDQTNILEQLESQTHPNKSTQLDNTLQSDELGQSDKLGKSNELGKSDEMGKINLTDFNNTQGYSQFRGNSNVNNNATTKDSIFTDQNNNVNNNDTILGLSQVSNAISQDDFKDLNSNAFEVRFQESLVQDNNQAKNAQAGNDEENNLFVENWNRHQEVLMEFLKEKDGTFKAQQEQQQHKQHLEQQQFDQFIGQKDPDDFAQKLSGIQNMDQIPKDLKDPFQKYIKVPSTTQEVHRSKIGGSDSRGDALTLRAQQGKLHKGPGLPQQEQQQGKQVGGSVFKLPKLYERVSQSLEDYKAKFQLPSKQTLYQNIREERKVDNKFKATRPDFDADPKAKLQARDFGHNELLEAKSGVLTNKQITALLVDAPNIQVLRIIMRKYRNFFNAINVSTAFSRFTKVVKNSQSRRAKFFMEQMCKLMYDHLPDFSYRSLAEIVWTLGRVAHYPGDEVMTKIANIYEQNIKDLSCIEISKIVWACAHLNFHPIRLYDLAAQEIIIKRRGFLNQQLVSILWAYAKLGHKHDKMFQAVAEEILERLPDFTAQGISNTIWAVGQMQFNDQKLMHGISLNTLHRVTDFKPQDLALMIYGFGQLKYQDKVVVDLMVKQCYRHVRKFTPESVKKLVWSLCELEYLDYDVFEEIADLVKEKLQDFETSQIAQIMLNFSQVNWPQLEFFAHVAENIRFRLAQFSNYQLVMLMQTYSKPFIVNRQLFNEIIPVVRSRLDVAPKHEYLLLLECYGKAQVVNEQLQGTFRRTFTARLQDLNNQELTQSAVYLKDIGCDLTQIQPYIFNQIASQQTFKQIQ